MLIQLEYDYNGESETERKSGLYVHIVKDPEDCPGYSDCEQCGGREDCKYSVEARSSMALIRVEYDRNGQNPLLMWYESQNGTALSEREAEGGTIADNMDIIREALLAMFPGAEIDESELVK